MILQRFTRGLESGRVGSEDHPTGLLWGYYLVKRDPKMKGEKWVKTWVMSPALVKDS